MSKSNQTTMQSEIFIVLMIFAILLFIVVFQTLDEIKIEKKKVEEEKIALQEAIDKYHLTPKQVEDLQNTMAMLRKHQQPPLIKVEVDNLSFVSGSAQLSRSFKRVLEREVATINNYVQKYSCDMVEVYGYTDGEAYPSNNTGVSFDKDAHKCLSGLGCNIQSTSNLELGMARAISVRNFLKSKLANNQKIKIIRPYSGGEFIGANGEIASRYDTAPNANRRRIEIRVTRRKDVTKN